MLRLILVLIIGGGLAAIFVFRIIFIIILLRAHFFAGQLLVSREVSLLRLGLALLLALQMTPWMRLLSESVVAGRNGLSDRLQF